MIMNMAIGGFKAYFTATYPADTTTLKCVHEDGTTLTASSLSSSGGTYAFEIVKKGKWHLTATKSSTSQSTTGVVKNVIQNRGQYSDTIEFEDIGIGGTINVTAPANITVQVIKGNDQSTIQRKSSGSTGLVSFSIHDGGVWTVSAANCESVQVKISTQGQTVSARLRMPVTVYISGATYSDYYDGSNHSVNTWTVTRRTLSEYADNKFKCNKTAAQLTVTRKNAGRTNMPLSASDFQNLDDDYLPTFEVTAGYVEVKAISVTVTVSGDQKTFNYDGQNHTASGYTLSISDSRYSASYVSCSQSSAALTLTRKDAGDYKIALQAGWFSNNEGNGNFAVTFNISSSANAVRLVISSRNLRIEITGRIASKVYDGKACTAEGYDWKAYYKDSGAACNDYSSSSISTGSKNLKASQTNVGTNTIALSASDFTNSDGRYTVEFQIKRNISATVTGKQLYIKADNKTKNAGSADPQFTATVSSGGTTLATGVTSYGGLNFTFSLSGTTISVAVSGSTSNYDITTGTGTLTTVDPYAHITASVFGYQVILSCTDGTNEYSDTQQNTVTLDVPPGTYSGGLVWGSWGQAAGNRVFSDVTLSAGQTFTVM